MTQTFITIKTTKKVLKLLRIICALTDEKQYQVLERVLKTELDKVKSSENIIS